MMSFFQPVLRWFAAGGLFSFFATMSLGGGPQLPPGFSANLYGGNLGGISASAMEFAPDGRLFICTQEGIVRVVTSNGTLLQEPFVMVPTSLDGERGLGGIAFDP